MHKLLYNPKGAFVDISKQGFAETVLYLLCGVILWFFAVKVQGLEWLSSLYVLLGLIALLILGSIVLNMMMIVLGKGSFLKSLMTLIAPWSILGLGLFVISLVTLIPKAGFYMAALVMIFLLPFAFIVEIKLFMDLFKADLLTAVVVLFILGAGTAAGLSVLLGSFAATIVSKLGFGLLPAII